MHCTNIIFHVHITQFPTAPPMHTCAVSSLQQSHGVHVMHRPITVVPHFAFRILPSAFRNLPTAVVVRTLYSVQSCLHLGSMQVLLVVIYYQYLTS